MIEYQDVDYWGWETLPDEPQPTPVWADETIVEEHENEVLFRHRYVPPLAPAEVDAVQDVGRLHVEVSQTVWREFADAAGRPMAPANLSRSFPVLRLVLERVEDDDRDPVIMDMTVAQADELRAQLGQALGVLYQSGVPLLDLKRDDDGTRAARPLRSQR